MEAAEKEVRLWITHYQMAITQDLVFILTDLNRPLRSRRTLRLQSLDSNLVNWTKECVTYSSKMLLKTETVRRWARMDSIAVNNKTLNSRLILLVKGMDLKLLMTIWTASLTMVRRTQPTVMAASKKLKVFTKVMNRNAVTARRLADRIKDQISYKKVMITLSNWEAVANKE